MKQQQRTNHKLRLSMLLLVASCVNLALQAEAARVTGNSDYAPPPSLELIEQVRNQPTTNAPAAAAIDEPQNSETTSRVESETESEDIMCNVCYENIQEAQNLLDQHNFLLEKQKNLIKKRKKSLAGGGGNPKTMRKYQQQEQSTSTNRSQVLGGSSSSSSSTSTTGSQVTTRTSRTVGTEANSIIVSRLLVTRSTRLSDSQESNQEPVNQQRVASHQKFKGPKIRSYPKSESNSINSMRLTTGTTGGGGGGGVSGKKDPELENIRLKLNKAHNATCKALNAMQDCLEGLSQKCYGNLRFHSFELFSDQWRSKLNCPYRNYPNVKPLRNLRSSLANLEAYEDLPKAPKVRPISSDEEVGKRLDRLLAGKSRPPFGVMLKPTLTHSGFNKFQSLGSNSGQYYQNNQQQHGMSLIPNDYSGVKGGGNKYVSSIYNNYAGDSMHTMSTDNQQDQYADLSAVRFALNPFLVVPCFLVLAAILSTVAIILMRRAIYLETSDCLSTGGSDSDGSETSGGDGDDEKRDMNNLYATIQKH